jgi:hypothetical protein
MTVHRALNVIFPKRFTWLTKPLNLLKITVALYIFVFSLGLIQVFRYMTYRTVIGSDNTTVLTPAACVLFSNLQIIYNFFGLFHRTSSFMIIVIANFVIVQRLFKSKKATNKNSESYLSRKEYAFAFSLIFNNFILFVLVTPFLCIQFVQLNSVLTPMP